MPDRKLYYGLSGRCSTRQAGPVAEANTTAGPLRSSLSCHPVGRTVFESLVAGIPSPDSGSTWLVDDAVDLAPWELPELPDPLRGPPRLRGLARVLVGRFQHALLLVPDAAGENVVDATLTWAWRVKRPEVEDPYLIYQESRKGDRYPRPASAARALWRDLDALLMKDLGEDHVRRPVVFDAVEYLPAEVVEELRVRVFGFDQDGQTRDRQFFTAVTPPVLRWLEERDGRFAVGISATRVDAEQVGRNLVGALRAAWADQTDPGDDGIHPPRGDADVGPWVAAAEGRYWPQAEKVFWSILDGGDFDASPVAFVEVAERVYDDIADQVGSRAHWRMTRALTRHRYRIRRGRAAVRPKDAA